jgi:tetratricopeptide (TPR) repeat protein
LIKQGMRMLRLGLAVMLLALSTGRLCAAESRNPEAAVTFVFSRNIGGTSCGNGFVVGDGTIIVTARHLVFPQRLKGLHQGESMVTVFSPYLGDAAEVDVVAQDAALDLIILRGPWKGHPALELAEEADLVAAANVEVVGFTDCQAAVTAGQPRLLDSVSLKRATLGVNAITVRQSISRTILTNTAPPGPGWAGAPIFLGNIDARKVAGCFSRTQGDGSAGIGTSAGAIRKLIDQSNLSPALTSTNPAPSDPGHSPAATLEYFRAVAASAAGNSKLSLEHLQSFLKLRPNSAIGYRELAGQLHALGRLAESQNAYAKALEINPAMISARVLYGQLLQERILPGAAEEHLRYAWRQGRRGTSAAIPLCNLLREQGKEPERLKVLTEAVERNPFDGHLWNYLGQSRRMTSDHAGAAAAFARSADLMPENESIRLRAADEFEAAGNDTQAAEQYRLLLAEHEESATAHYSFARFLGRDTTRREQALNEARLALNFADRPGAPPRAMIQSLISAIRAERASDASDFRL